MSLGLLPDTVPKPPWHASGKALESKIRKAIHHFQLLPGVEGAPPQKVAVAVSGGKDSITLLVQLCAIVGRGVPACELGAFFVDGPFSCGAGVNKKYLQALCDSLGVPLTVCSPSSEEEEIEDELPTDCYSCSRQRRSLLFAAAKEWGASYIAFGHHQDDCVHTLLMNTLHKGEFAGMLPKVPMLRYGITIIRPMIYVTEDEIRSFAEAHKFLRTMCQCPVGQVSMRKRASTALRTLEELFPRARGNLFLAGMQYGSQKALDP